MPRRKRSEIDPLQPVLRHVEEELRENLERACVSTDPTGESTGELEKLSETLGAASRQARAAAALRRRMNDNQLGDRLGDRLRERSTPPAGEDQAAAPPDEDAPPGSAPTDVLPRG